MLDPKAILELPLNGRNVHQLDRTCSRYPRCRPGRALPRLSGSRPRTNEYLYDGNRRLQPEPGQVAFSPSLNAIREFQCANNDSSAAFGRFNGGVVNLTTKSGSNEFHGTVFEFLRNEALNARNLFSRRRRPIPTNRVPAQSIWIRARRASDSRQDIFLCRLPGKRGN